MKIYFAFVAIWIISGGLFYWAGFVEGRCQEAEKNVQDERLRRRADGI